MQSSVCVVFYKLDSYLVTKARYQSTKHAQLALLIASSNHLTPLNHHVDNTIQAVELGNART